MKPEIRFKGFTDEWVEKKLGEVSKIQTGSSNAKDASDQGEYPFYIRSDDVKRSNKYLFDGEAILIPGEGRIGEIFHYANGKFDFHQRVYAISSFQELCGMYLLNVLRKNFGHHAKKYSVKATVDSLRLPIIQQFPIQLPTLPEQQKIGALFSKYDIIIALREQNLAELNALKKGLLQQMFPKNGVKVPELRFARFADGWEEHKLGEVAEVKYGHDYKNVSQIGNIPVYGTGGVLAMIDKFQSESSDAVGLGRKGTINKPFVLKAPFWTVDTLFQIYPKVSLDLFFQLYLFNNINWLKYNESTGVPSLSKLNIEAVVRNIPSLPEQQKIGQLFKQLDDRISNEQTKIAQLKAQKQGLLQRML